MATLGNYFYDGNSFQLASVLCTDSQLQTPAPDGWYAQGGVYRQIAAGLLGTVQTCASCLYSCGGQAVSPGSNGFGQYRITVDLGTGTGAAIAEFTVGTDSAARCTWTYDGQSASEYSSPNYGYCQGLIGDENLVGISNATGSNGNSYVGQNFNFTNPSWTSQGTATWGPYANKAAGGVDLTPGGGYGTCIMVVPKPNSAPNSVTFVIDRTSTQSGDWTFKVNCPGNLTPMNVDGDMGIDCPDACNNMVNPQIIHRALVSGTVPMPAANDWVFADAAGVSEWADGYWRVAINGNYYCMETLDSVIVNFNICI